MMRKISWGITIFFWLAALTATHLPAKDLPRVPVSDKLEHYLGYGFLAGCLFVSLKLHGTREVGVKVLIILMIYGAIDEWTQALPFIKRSSEFADWCADCAGIATAVGSLTLLTWIFPSKTSEGPGFARSGFRKKNQESVFPEP
jgi:VanZ family protein